MKRFFGIIATIATVALSSCTYDDSEIWERLNEYGEDIENHEARITALEELCQQMNSNISALHTIVLALQNNDYVTAVAPIVKDGKTIGYTITFSKSGPITIFNGEDGADGYSPTIGIRKDSDEVYYWTLDGEWMLDESSSKIKAVGDDGKDGSDGKDGQDGEDGTDGKDGNDGADGKDGITPRLKIEDDYWYISYDDGATWAQLGRATGEDGTDGTDGKDGEDGEDGKDGDSMFRGVTQDDDNVYFTLADGSVITIPKFNPASLDIIFDQTEELVCAAGASVEVGYTIVGDDDTYSIECLGDGGWRATAIEHSNTQGVIRVTAPKEASNGKVVVLAMSSAGGVVMRSLHFDEGLLSGIYDRYEVSGASNILEVDLRTNLSYDISMSAGADSWISLADTRSTLRNETLTFSIDRNNSDTTRSATISLIGDYGDVLRSFIISQEPLPTDDRNRFHANHLDIIYYGNEYSTTFVYNIILSDSGIGEDGYFNDGTTFYQFELHSTTQASYDSGTLPSGTYTLSTTPGPNIFDYSYSYMTASYNGGSELRYFSEGTVTIADNMIEADITTEDGVCHYVTYEGALTWGDR